MSKNKLARSALVIATGGFLSKIIGAVYRIPLTTIIGAEGIGLYQLVFPLYTALLTLSSTGLPTALSKLVAQNEKDAVGYFRRSVVLFGGIGLMTSVLMFVLGGILAKLQGNYQAAWCYRALSPSVFFVSVISCLRGYFQGKGIMYPTALSQVLEQIVKAAFGLGVCYIFKNNIIIAAVMATFAVTVSEVVALVFLLVIYKIKVRGKYGKKNFNNR